MRQNNQADVVSSDDQLEHEVAVGDLAIGGRQQRVGVSAIDPANHVGHQAELAARVVRLDDAQVGALDHPTADK